jgi:hypothetical protein
MQFPTTSGGRAAGYRIGSDQSAGIPASATAVGARRDGCAGAIPGLAISRVPPPIEDKSTNRKERRKTAKLFKMLVADTVYIRTFGLITVEGVEWFWCRVPNDNMTGEEVIAMGDRHRPFTTKAEAEEDLRVVLFGADTKIVEGGSLKRDPVREGLH